MLNRGAEPPLWRATARFRTSANDYSGLGNDSGWVISGTGADLMIDGTLVPEPPAALLVGIGLLLLGSFARPVQARPRSVQSSANLSR